MAEATNGPAAVVAGAAAVWAEELHVVHGYTLRWCHTYGGGAKKSVAASANLLFMNEFAIHKSTNLQGKSERALNH
jgi:hypothetical protein